jgi:tripartite-type tricarboxylate transporter receptor subunit TctC
MTPSPLSRRTFASLLALAWLAAPLAASAADYPAKPIRFIVPYTPGGTTDLVARTVGQKVSEKLGQPVLIDNRGGAGGNIGMDAVAKAPADGYTIGFGAISTNALNPHIYKSMAFDPRKDFSAISLLGTSTIVLEVPAVSPIKTVADLVAAARKQPGMPYATAGAGTSMNLAGVMFAQMTGTELTHVAYKGSGPGLNATHDPQLRSWVASANDAGTDFPDPEPAVWHLQPWAAGRAQDRRGHWRPGAGLACGRADRYRRHERVDGAKPGDDERAESGDFARAC